MAQKIFISLILILLILIIKSEPNNTNIVSLKFKTYYPYTNNSDQYKLSFNVDDYLEKIHFSKIYLEIGVGNESSYESKINQTLNIIVDLEEIVFSTTSEYFSEYATENNNILCNYNTSKSPTFYEDEGYYNIYGIKTLSSYASEFFKIFTNIDLTEYNITELKFINTINHKSNNICGNIGLSYLHKESKVYNLIGELHSKFNLLDYSIFFNYSSQNSDEGFVVFGNMPYNFLPKKYNEDDFKSVYSNLMKIPIFNLIQMTIKGNKINEMGEMKIRINPDIEGIEFPEFFFKYLEDNFFQDYYNKSICHAQKSNRLYKIIQCEVGKNKFNEKSIKSFPKLSFYILRDSYFNISFNGEDLFYQKDNKYYFRIIESSMEEDFVFGRLLFKKYITIFNQDKKQIIFYDDLNLDNKDEEINFSKKSNTNYKIIIMVACIICAIIFFTLGIYFGYKIFKKRGKVAYELNDGYDYTPAQDGNEAVLP